MKARSSVMAGASAAAHRGLHHGLEPGRRLVRLLLHAANLAHRP